MLFEFGCGGVERNKNKAMVLYQKALALLPKCAEEGDADSMFSLGECFEHGRGVAKNEAKALEWYIRAAEIGHADAMHSIGVFFSQGMSVEKDQT